MLYKYKVIFKGRTRASPFACHRFAARRSWTEFMEAMADTGRPMPGAWDDPTGRGKAPRDSYRSKSRLLEAPEAVSGGWPLILSNLKSLLETGEIAMKDKIRW